MNRIKILIIEDDMLRAESLKDTLSDYGYQVIGIAPNAKEAITLAKKHAPDLIISDINLDGEVTGIQAVKEIKKHIETVVIFLTVEGDSLFYDQANQTSPDQFLIKPYDDRGVLLAVRKALERKALEQDGIEKLTGQSFFIKKGQSQGNNYHQKIEVDDILFVQADDNYATFHLRNDVFYEVTMNLKRISDFLVNTSVVRVHKSYLVNTDRVVRIHSDRQRLELEEEVEVPYSRERSEEIKAMFSILKTKGNYQ